MAAIVIICRALMNLWSREPLVRITRDHVYPAAKWTSRICVIFNGGRLKLLSLWMCHFKKRLNELLVILYGGTWMHDCKVFGHCSVIKENWLWCYLNQNKGWRRHFYKYLIQSEIIFLCIYDIMHIDWRFIILWLRGINGQSYTYIEHLPLLT